MDLFKLSNVQRVVTVRVKPYELVSNMKDIVVEKNVENNIETVYSKEMALVEDYETETKEDIVIATTTNVISIRCITSRVTIST